MTTNNGGGFLKLSPLKKDGIHRFPLPEVSPLFPAVKCNDG